MRWDQDLIRNPRSSPRKAAQRRSRLQIRNAPARTALAMPETAKKRAAQAEAALTLNGSAQRPGRRDLQYAGNNGDRYRTYGDGRKTLCGATEVQSTGTVSGS